MKNDLDITKPRYSEQILPVPWAFVVSRLRCICFRDHCHPVKLEIHKTDNLFSFFTAPKMIPNPEIIPKLTPK